MKGIPEPEWERIQRETAAAAGKAERLSEGAAIARTSVAARRRPPEATPNVLRVPRPAGSGRPNKGRKLTSLYLDEWLIEAADALAKAEQVNRSEMLRRLVAEALHARESRP